MGVSVGSIMISVIHKNDSTRSDLYMSDVDFNNALDFALVISNVVVYTLYVGGKEEAPII